MIRGRRLIVLGLSLALIGQLIGPAPQAQAELPTGGRDLHCPNAEILGPKLITGVCWSCMFPVYLAGFQVIDGRFGRPDGHAEDRICFCEGDLSEGELPTIGFTVGLWVPSRIMEAVRKPWCFPSLFGADLGNANVMDGGMAWGGGGRQKNNMDSEAMSFWSWHMYAFPLLEILGLLNMPQCNTDNYSTFDVMFMSEPFPHWYDGELAFLINPEALIFANPIAQAAALVDCTAASTNESLNALFWVAGCWGSTYPLTGHTGTGSEPMTASLAVTRAMFLLGRLGFLKRTVGDDVLCEGGQRMPVLRKNQYAFQQMFPVPESNNNDPGSNPAPPDIDPATETTIPATQTGVNNFSIGNVRGGCCHRLGENSLLWGEWRTRPATGEDFVYLVWRWTDCCVGLLGEGG